MLRLAIHLCDCCDEHIHVYTHTHNHQKRAFVLGCQASPTLDWTQSTLTYFCALALVFPKSLDSPQTQDHIRAQEDGLCAGVSGAEHAVSSIAIDQWTYRRDSRSYPNHRLWVQIVRGLRHVTYQCQQYHVGEDGN